MVNPFLQAVTEDAERIHLATFGEDVERRLGGPRGNRETVTAVWMPSDNGGKMAGGFGTDRDDTGGTKIVRFGELSILPTQGWSRDDAWFIRGELWQTHLPGNVIAGLRRIVLRREDIQVRTKLGNVVR